MKPTCPQCHAVTARRIRHFGPVERFLNLFAIYSFRCQLCAHRFRRLDHRAEHRALPDQRQFERLPTNVRATIIGMQGESADFITDLSMGGCTLQTCTALTKGAFLRLGLRASDDEPAIFVETAMVRSVRPQAVGLEFLELDDVQKERLRQWVRSLLTDPTSPAMA